MINQTETELFALFERLLQCWHSEKKSLPQQPFDKEWLSPCNIGQEKDEEISWQAIKRKDSPDLSNIEAALDLKLHPSICEFFCTAYAYSIPCLFTHHPIELIQVCNEDDFKMLQENMIAHFMMQKRLGKPASMFIASCSDEMQIISIINETGQVQLETLGKGQEQILAENVAEFLKQLQPVV